MYTSRYGRKVSVIKNVPRLNVASSSKTSAVLNTAYLGVLNPGRGLQELVTEIRKRPHINLTLIGDGPLKSELIYLSRESKNIKFLGAIQPDKISIELENVQFGWNLLEGNSKSYYYSLANKFFDYIHHGIPVVTMNFPEYSKLVKKFDCGFLIADIESSSIQSILDKLESTFKEKDQLNRLQQNCAIAAKANSWEQESKKLLELIIKD